MMQFYERVMKREEIIWNKDLTGVPVIFWGCGNNARIVKETLKGKGIVPCAYCDNSKDLIGNELDGVPVLSYEEVKERYKKYVLILTVAVENAQVIYSQLMDAKEMNPILHIEKAFKCEEGFLEFDDIEADLEKYEEIYEMLCDEQSKEIFVNHINFKLSGNKMSLLSFVDGDTFFDENIITYKDNYTYVDVGAYTGDTLMRFYAFCRGKYNAMYAIDPDKGNFQCMERLVKYARLKNVHLFNVGGWNEKGKLVFYTLANNEDENFDSPNFFKGMEETLPISCKVSGERYVEEIVPVDTVDNLLQGERCDVIKINALAADYQVLEGSRKTIERYTPVIVGEYGTQKEYLLEFLKVIKEIEPRYKIFLRQKRIFGDCKTIYIATV